MNERTIFLEALEIADPAQRDAYLEQACAGDATLRQNLAALIKSHEEASGFLQKPAVEQMAARTDVADSGAKKATPQNTDVTQAEMPYVTDSDLSFLAPSTNPGFVGRLGHYEIQGVIGKGGFGIVLRAFDEKLHRIVAIKVLSPAYAANGSARTRFNREARTAAAVKNDHVVAIHSVEDEAMPPYLVMELIDGISLQDKIDKKGPLDLKEILRIGMQAAEGLAAAHKQGLVHRDIKPANILLENGVERVKITDFGLARAVDDASVTQSGVVAGTPMYMSPEQAEGQPPHQRSDLFSLGTVLYAMCTGHPPFRATGTIAVLKRVIEDTPRPIREINSEIPDWLCDIISKLHAKKPADRFQSAKEVADLLGQHLAHLQQPATYPAPPRIAPPKHAASAISDERIAEGRRRVQGQLRTAAQWMLLCGALGLLMGVGLLAWLAVRYWGEGFRQDRFQEYLVMASALLMHGTIFTMTWHFMRQGRARQVHMVSVPLFGIILPLVLIGSVYTQTQHWPMLIPFVLGVPIAARAYWLMLRDSDAIVRYQLERAMAGASAPKARSSSWIRTGAVIVAVGAILAAGLAWGPFLYRYAANQSTLIFSGLMDPNLDKILVKQEGATVAELTTLEGMVHLPAGDYETEVVPKAGFKLSKFRIGSASSSGSSGWHQATSASFPVRLARGDHVSINVELEKMADEPSKTPPEPSWVPLFNGTDLKGWDPQPPSDWGIKDGRLVAKVSVGVCTLRTERVDYQDFRLRFQAKARTGLGLAARSGEHGGYHLEYLHEMGTCTYQWGSGDPKPQFAAWKGPATGPEEWLDGEVLVQGSRMTYFLNGVKVAELKDVPIRKGRFYLTATARRGNEVEFKNVEIKELPPENTGWVDLFNEANLDGWTPTSKGWSVKDKAILADGTSPGWLIYSKRDFSDFELEFEYRLPKKGRGGLCLRAGPDPTSAALANALNINLREFNPGSTNLGGALPLATLTEQWNKARIRVAGKLVEIFVNGLRANRFSLDDYKDKVAKNPVLGRTSGRIALRQDTKVEYRNIRVKELPPEEPGWAQLFNGKDLTGWKQDDAQKATWRLANDVVIAEGRGDAIWTDRSDYENFHLRMDVKTVTGSWNALVRTEVSESKGRDGFLLFTSNTNKDLDVTFFGLHQFGTAGAILPGYAADWHNLEVIANRNHLQVLVNGKVAIDFADRKYDCKKGKIGLGIVADGKNEVHFRNVKIKELPATQNFVQENWQDISPGASLKGWRELRGKNKMQGSDRGPAPVLEMPADSGSLVTERKDLGDFHLRMEVATLGDTNATLNVRAGDDPKTGYAIQLGRGPNWKPGSVDRMTPKSTRPTLRESYEEPIPEIWYALDVITKGNRLVVKVNNKVAVDWVDVSNPIATGAIAIHSLDRGTLRIRRVEILEPAPPPDPFLVAAAELADVLKKQLTNSGSKYVGLGDFERLPPKFRSALEKELATRAIKFVPAEGVRPREELRVTGKLDDFRAAGNSTPVQLQYEITGATGGGKGSVSINGAPPRRTPDLAPGWEDLFNGKDFEGWVPQKDQWKVSDFVLTGAAESGLHRMGTVRKDFADFHLRVEAKIRGPGNSGIFFRDVYQAEIDTMQRTGSLALTKPWKLLELKKHNLVKENEWFTMEIIAKGSRVTTKVNEQLVAELTDATAAPGDIALELDARDGPVVLEIRKLAIKETPREEPGWVRLFNGKDLTGWEGDSNVWSWKDDLLVGNAVKQGPDKGNAKRFDLRSVKSFKDFELKFEARLESPLGLAGVLIRGPAGMPIAPTRQMGKFSPRYTTAKTNEFLPGAQDWNELEKIIKPGFNDFHLRCQGNRVTLKLNGITTLDNETVPELAENGPIVFRVIGLSNTTPGTAVSFREMRIREIKPPEEPGWEQLYNGKDLTGWTARSDKYFVKQDRTLLANASVNEYGMLHTKKSYENYELRMQVQVTGHGEALSKARAGVAFHVTNIDGALENVRHSAGLTVTSDRNWDMFAFSVRDLGEIKKSQKTKPPVDGSWHDVRVVCRDGRITIFFNGEERWSCSRVAPSKGHIGLWAIGGDCHFRNIEIKELQPEEPGFDSLFNGKDLEGWNIQNKMDGLWTVDLGVLKGTAKKAKPYQLFSQTSYENFHFRTKVQVKPGSNGTIYVRIRDALGWKGVGVKMHHLTARDLEVSLFSTLNPVRMLATKRRELGADQWFDLEIIARGPRFEVKIDDVSAIVYTFSAEDAAKHQTEGGIVFEVPDANSMLSFSKIEVKELPRNSVLGPRVDPMFAPLPDLGEQKPVERRAFHIRFFPNSNDLFKKVKKTVDGKEVEELYDPNVEKSLQDIADLIKKAGPTSHVVIEGHADNLLQLSARADGLMAAERGVVELSLTRARAVAESLVAKHSVDAKRLSVVGHGLVSADRCVPARRSCEEPARRGRHL